MFSILQSSPHLRTTHLRHHRSNLNVNFGRFRSSDSSYARNGRSASSVVVKANKFWLEGTIDEVYDVSLKLRFQVDIPIAVDRKDAWRFLPRLPLPSSTPLPSCSPLPPNLSFFEWLKQTVASCASHIPSLPPKPFAVLVQEKARDLLIKLVRSPLGKSQLLLAGGFGFLFGVTVFATWCYCYYTWLSQGFFSLCSSVFATSRKFMPLDSSSISPNPPKSSLTSMVFNKVKYFWKKGPTWAMACMGVFPFLYNHWTFILVMVAIGLVYHYQVGGKKK